MEKTRKAKLVVFEGIDGSGKSTQIKYLENYLKEKGVNFCLFKFPRHGRERFGKLVDAYLKGEFGDPTRLNAYFSSLLYTADRFEEKTAIEDALRERDWVVMDRYVGSNLAHQRVKLKSEAQWKEYMKWMDDLEYKKLGLPRPDVVLYFKVPFEAAKKIIRGEDGHERNLNYLRRVKEAYEAIAKSKKEWQIIESGKGHGMLSREEIFEKVKQVLNI
ncbi:MAG: dTMP kinase [Patescibacteria group bacterium]|nr:dTMP kinase [Patescibacteria group bacterium]